MLWQNQACKSHGWLSTNDKGKFVLNLKPNATYHRIIKREYGKQKVLYSTACTITKTIVPEELN
jgi:hypothetical protein